MKTKDTIFFTLGIETNWVICYDSKNVHKKGADEMFIATCQIHRLHIASYHISKASFLYFKNSVYSNNFQKR